MKNGTLTLHGCVFQRLTSRPQLGNPHQTTIQSPKGPNFQTELIPVHSPLLRESCLVSYPPLTYMLKFSGFADLTSCLGGRAAKASPKDPEGHKHTACTTNSSPKSDMQTRFLLSSFKYTFVRRMSSDCHEAAGI